MIKKFIPFIKLLIDRDVTKKLSEVEVTGNIAWDSVTGKPSTFPPSTHSHSEYSPTGHDHAGVYSPDSHTHNYEPANANIQAHVTSTHAPVNAQANADITKAEIEAKLTGQIATHTHAGASAPTVVTLANDATTGANTTPITLTGLVFNFEANSKYKIELLGAVSSAAATTGCGFQFDVSAAVTSIWFTFFHQLANTGTLTGGNSIADDASQGVSSGIPANAGVYPVAGFGLLRTGANTGTAQLRFRSETTAPTTCKAGTTLIITKL